MSTGNLIDTIERRDASSGGALLNNSTERWGQLLCDDNDDRDLPRIYYLDPSEVRNRLCLLTAPGETRSDYSHLSKFFTLLFSVRSTVDSLRMRFQDLSETALLFDESLQSETARPVSVENVYLDHELLDLLDETKYAFSAESEVRVGLSDADLDELGL